MKGYILFKNGKCSYEENIKCKKLKNGKVKAILLECFHPVFGFFYVAQDMKRFKMTSKYASKSIVSYRFLDGQYVDESDDCLFVKK